MALFRRLSDGKIVPLPARALVGRAGTCTLVVDNEYASSEHARIGWSGDRWEVRDLGSRNGTFLDGERLMVGEPTWLPGGARLGFGGVEAQYELIDDGPPEAMAIRLDDGYMRAAQSELLALPSEDDPVVTLFRGAAGTWEIEHADGQTESAADEQVVTVAGTAWRLVLPTGVEATPHVDMSLVFDRIILELYVSRDEERAGIGLRHHGVVTTLEPREHAYLLVLLARARQDDADKPDAERGWRTVDELRRMLRVEPNAINVLIHRARQQLADVGLEGGARIVEVKRGARRLGTPRFELGALDDD